MAETEKDIVRKVLGRYDEGARFMQDVINEMEQSRLFYRGDQWLKYFNRQWRPAPEAKSRVRLTINKLPGLVESWIATYLRFAPIILANPSTDEEDDRIAAKLGEKILVYLWDVLKMDVQSVDLLLKKFCYGNVFQRVDWDWENDRPSLDVVSPMSFVPEPGATSIEDAGWMFVVEYLRCSELEGRYNTKIEPSSYSEEFLHIPMMIDKEANYSEKERAALYQMYERPTREYPDGRIVYVVNERRVDERPLPKNSRGVPEVRIAHFRNIPLPDEFWATSFVSNNVPLQSEYNRGRSQLVENRNLCARPQIIAPEGTLEENAWNNKPGKIVYWNPLLAHGHEPHYVTPPSVPGWVMAILNMANEEMMDISSRHEVSQGALTGAVTSGKMAESFRRADDSRLAPGIKLFEAGLKQIGQWMLSECCAHWGGDRVLNIVGKNREYEVVRFNASQISDKINVTYEIGSQIPWGRENMRQQIIYLNSIGKLDDESARRMLQLPTPQGLYEDKQDHRLNARRENQLLLKGFFSPLPTDDHPLHKEEHRRYVNSPEVRSMLVYEMQAEHELAQLEGRQPLRYPKSLENILKHMNEHDELEPKQAPPPPAPKINLNLDRLLQNPVVATNPQLLETLLPALVQLVSQSANPAGAGEPMPEGTRAPMPESGGVGTPPGLEGSEDAIYGAGHEAGRGMI